MLSFRIATAVVFSLSASLIACSPGTSPTNESAAPPADTSASTAPAPEIDLGPAEYDASGTMPCSRGSAEFDKACGFRVVRDGQGGAEIWISNSIDGQPFYRVLSFADGEFTVLRDDATAEVAKDGDMWTVTVGEERYRFADAAITGG